MPYLYLLGAMCCSAVNNIVSSAFNRKNADAENVSTTYNILVTLSALIFWGAVYAADFEFTPGVLVYSLAYGIFYTMSLVGLYQAMHHGSVSLTAFVKQLSLIAVALWGFVFWDAPLEANILIGMVLIVAALYLCFKADKKSESRPATLRWFFFAMLLLIGNAGCSITQKYQQSAFGGRYGDMLMFFGAMFSASVCVILYLSQKRCRLRDISAVTLVFPVLGGIGSALLNMFIILLIASTLSESIFFPGIAVGALLITTLFSAAVYREKLLARQWIGLTVGAVALVFLNL